MLIRQQLEGRFRVLVRHLCERRLLRLRISWHLLVAVDRKITQDIVNKRRLCFRNVLSIVNVNTHTYQSTIEIDERGKFQGILIVTHLFYSENSIKQKINYVCKIDYCSPFGSTWDTLLSF